MVLSSAISLLLGLNQFGSTDVSPPSVHQANVIPSAGVPSRDPEVAVPPPVPATDDGPFNWTNVAPTDGLDFKTMEKCFDNFLCARMNLPLDYSNVASPNITIAVTIFPATATGSDEYKGILMLNPGGPGGSGVDFLTGSASMLVELVGSGYDLVAFDPRGTGSSEPLARCFTVEEWLEFSPDEVLSFDRRQDVALYLARSQIVANRCFEELGGTGEQKPGGSVKDWGVGYYLGSADVANDMVRIMEALGRDQINYLGISYGTALGQYFAAMHPDKVNLMMIDAVLDAEPWSKGELIDTYQDTDEIIEAFYELCTRAGPDVCAVAESTKEATKKRVNDIINNLDENPLVIMPHVDGSFVLTASSLRAVTIGPMYSPGTGFPQLADTLATVEARNTSELFRFGAKDRTGGLGDQAYQAISCVDRADGRNTSFNTAVEWTKQADRTADFVDDAVARDQLMCVPWQMRPRNPFEGPFAPKGFKGKMLITNNVFDPVTPLAQARAVQARTPNSALLIQNGLGHSALGSAGACVTKVVSSFFQKGDLPETGTICQPDFLPFIGNVDEGIVHNAADKEKSGSALHVGGDGGRGLKLNLVSGQTTGSTYHEGGRVKLRPVSS